MTYLEKLIDQAATRGCVAQLTTAMEKAGADFAQELLADPEFRQTVRDLVRETTRRLVENLNHPVPKRRARKRTPR